MYRPWIEFSMALRRSASLVVGAMRFHGFDGKVVLDIPASSGLPGYQDFGHWMLKGKGPIPPSRMLPQGKEWELTLTPEQRPNAVGIEGPFYRISPGSVLLAPQLVRDGFGFHKDRNVIGSSGCPVPVEQSRAADCNFLAAEDVLAQWRAAGVATVTLKVEYL